MANSDQTIATPWIFVEAVEKFLGIEFRYDMAADGQNTKAEIFFTEKDDSLNIDWPLDGWIWINPPFNKLGPWIKKMREQQKRGCKIISVFPLATGQNRDPAWLHSNVHMVHNHRLWPEVRDIMVCEWSQGDHLPPVGLSWDRKAGALTKVWG